jgi:hypothetical protein
MLWIVLVLGGLGGLVYLYGALASSAERKRLVAEDEARAPSRREALEKLGLMAEIERNGFLPGGELRWEREGMSVEVAWRSAPPDRIEELTLRLDLPPGGGAWMSPGFSAEIDGHVWRACIWQSTPGGEHVVTVGGELSASVKDLVQDNVLGPVSSVHAFHLRHHSIKTSLPGHTERPLPAEEDARLRTLVSRHQPACGALPAGSKLYLDRDSRSPATELRVRLIVPAGQLDAVLVPAFSSAVALLTAVRDDVA